MEEKKILVVGSGITGATIARHLADYGLKVDVFEAKDVLAGACRDEYRGGAYLQIHGAHIFNTQNKEVWDFASRFTKWHPFMHKVTGCINGTYVPIPMNLNSLKMLVSEKDYKSYENLLHQECKFGHEFTLKELREHESEQLKDLGEFIFENVFKHYSNKQWGKFPDEAVINRVKAFRFSRDDRYFLTEYQGIPEEGYTDMIKRMLEHDNIKITYNKKVKLEDTMKYDRVFYTGPVDELFDYKFGELPYRSCVFKNTPYIGRYIQRESSVVNYPNSYDYTRTHDYSWFMPKAPHGIFSKEYPAEFKRDSGLERYYPIKEPENLEKFKSYSELAHYAYPHITLAGRLGTYQYFSMDKAIEQATEIAYEFLKTIA